ncbi:IPT/TIG domain-containing protein [Streptomyces sp. NPDC006430]|uniref:IPT/TIG domain-containing protein n=1 Tax=Streptomyces sp. NPDC006430 TaxID=3154299 RepID=UPI0033B8ACBB
MPSITSLSATQGHNGDALTITGTGLGTSATTTKVYFGGKKVTPNTVSSTSVTVTVPILCAGQVDVTVIVSGTLSNPKPFFAIGTPQCSFLSSNVAPEAPTVAITINGSGLATATAVQFGGTPTTSTVAPVGDSQIPGIVPPGHTVTGTDTDTVDVTVVTAGGTSVPAGGATQVTYYKLPTVTSVAPTSGSPGQTGIAVNGLHLVDVSAVTFTDAVTPANVFVVPLSDIEATSTTQVLVTAPAGLTPTLVYNVTATTPGGESTTSAAFTAS